MSASPTHHLREALEHIAALRRHVARHGVDDEVVVDACALRLSAAIEAVVRSTLLEDVEGFERQVRTMHDALRSDD